ncbi:MAG TPA: 5-(carboxyamino)imidazole ribonucleotide synthase [Polyangiaceae bacterium]
MSSTTPTRESSARRPRVGVLGAGQLGRMLALAGYPLGIDFSFVDPNGDSPAGVLAPLLAADYGSPEALAALAECDVVTYEFENVPVEAALALEARVPVRPSVRALGVSQDRLLEKRCFRELGIPTAPFFDVGSLAELEAAVEQAGLPAVLKTRRLGYDGKGQRVLRSAADVAPAFAELGGVPLILEGFVAFERELSLLAVRSATGETAFYPLVENHHDGGILRLSLLPAPNVDAELDASAKRYGRALLDRLDYVGVLALELFEAHGELYANEIAPRVHNSGHHSIEGAQTSQFENHLRAVLGLPLGSTEPVGCSAMLNCIGSMPDAHAVLSVPDAHLHDYGKTPRAGRKLGHVTLRAPDRKTLAERLSLLRPKIWQID